MSQDGETSERRPTPSSGPVLTAGGHVAGGRYRLDACHGGYPGLAFWQAHDMRLRRDVALTFVDPLPGDDDPDSAAKVLDRTLDLSRVYSAGLAPLLDVVRGRGGGIVVAEWTPGSSLAEASRDLDPEAAAEAVRPLAEASERAVDSGSVISLDTPDRVRLTPDGLAVLAFPGVPTAADEDGDIRGLGATLETLLSGHWPLPLPDGSDAHEPVDGRPELSDGPPAERGTAPSGLAAIAERALDGTGISSVATMHSLLKDFSGDRRPAGFSLGTGAAAAGAMGAGAAGGAAAASGGGRGSGEDSGWSESRGSDRALLDYSGDDESAPSDRRRWIAMAVGSAIAVAAAVAVGLALLGGITGDNDSTPLSQQLDRIEREAQQSREAAAARAAEAENEGGEDEGDEAPPTTTEQSEPAGELDTSGATAWEPSDSPGQPDNPGAVSNLIDGSAGTSWSTSSYQAQFGSTPPSWKTGTGVIVTLSEASRLREVELTASTPGIEVEIRGASSSSPSSVGDTDLLATLSPSGTSAVTEDIDEDEEYEYVLVWVTQLQEQGTGSYAATLDEVVFKG